MKTSSSLVALAASITRVLAAAQNPWRNGGGPPAWVSLYITAAPSGAGPPWATDVPNVSNWGSAFSSYTSASPAAWSSWTAANPQWATLTGPPAFVTASGAGGRPWGPGGPFGPGGNHNGWGPWASGSAPSGPWTSWWGQSGACPPSTWSGWTNGPWGTSPPWTSWAGCTDTWDGLDVIGFAKEDEWLERGSVPAADEYSRYDADVTPRSVSLASHQAAVELAIMQLLGKPLAGVCEVSSHNEQIQQMIDACSFVGSDSSPALRFADQQSMETLVFIFNQIGGKTESQVESPEKLIFQEKESVDGLRNSTSLADPAVKFAFAKRFSQLLCRRIPDQVISDANTVGDLAAGLNTPLKEKPINVTKTLARGEKAGTLPPNLKFSSKRITKGDHDEDVGRKKAIVSELYRRGLIVSKDKKKPAAFH